MTNQNTNYDYCKGVEKSVVDKSALVRLCGVLGVLTENNDLSTAALLAATRIESLEKKIPALNVDLAEASMHAYNGEVSRMNLEAELARLTAELAELRERMRWISVSERLPEVDDGYCVDVVAINMNGDKKPFTAMYAKNIGFDALSTTHWMYISDLISTLPEPPEATDETTGRAD